MHDLVPEREQHMPNRALKRDLRVAAHPYVPLAQRYESLRNS